VSSVQGPEPTRAGRPGSSRSFFRALAIAALLLIAAIAATPANAQEAPPGTTATDPVPVTDAPPPDQPPASGDTGTTNPPPESGPPADPPPADPPPADPPPADPPPADTPPATGTGDSGSGGGSGSGSEDRPAHQGGGTTSSTNGPADSWAPSSSTSGSGDTTVVSPAAKDDYPDSWLGQDTFIVDNAGGGSARSAAASAPRRFAGLILLGATSHAKEIEATARRSHETAKVSALGGGPPGPGNPLPGQNPFFNLLSGPGGIAANLMLASLLAVLGAALVLPRDRSRAFRTPAVTWSPLAYVPPIELPG
jgi:hypothetical protein